MNELLTVSEVASLLKCSEDTVLRHFARRPGVVDLGQAGSMRKRRYRILRIPRVVYEKFLMERAI